MVGKSTGSTTTTDLPEASKSVSALSLNICHLLLQSSKRSCRYVGHRLFDLRSRAPGDQQVASTVTTKFINFIYYLFSGAGDENLVSRDGFSSSPVPRQHAHLHTQAESCAHLRDSCRVPRRRPFIYL